MVSTYEAEALEMVVAPTPNIGLQRTAPCVLAAEAGSFGSTSSAKVLSC